MRDRILRGVREIKQPPNKEPLLTCHARHSPATCPRGNGERESTCGLEAPRFPPVGGPAVAGGDNEDLAGIAALIYRRKRS